MNPAVQWKGELQADCTTIKMGASLTCSSKSRVDGTGAGTDGDGQRANR